MVKVAIKIVFIYYNRFEFVSGFEILNLMVKDIPYFF